MEACSENKRDLLPGHQYGTQYAILISRVYTTSLDLALAWPAKVTVARLNHYTIFLRLAHFGLEFCNLFCVFLCVVTLSAIVSH
jgi:hypothetical protein